MHTDAQFYVEENQALFRMPKPDQQSQHLLLLMAVLTPANHSGVPELLDVFSTEKAIFLLICDQMTLKFIRKSCVLMWLSLNKANSES